MAWRLMIWRSGVLFEMCLSGLCHDCFPSVPLFLNPQLIAKHALHLTSCYETLDPSSQCRSLHDEWGAGSWNLSNVWESKVVAMSGGPWCCPWSRFFMAWHLVMKEVMCMIVDNLRTIEHKSIWQVWQFRIIIMALSLEIYIPTICLEPRPWGQALEDTTRCSGRYKKMYTTCLGMKLDQVGFQNRWGPTSRPMVLLYIIYLNGRSVIWSLEVIAPSPCRLATAEIWVCCSLSFHHGPGPQMLPAVALSWLCLRGLEVDWRLLCLDRCQSCL